MNKDTQNFKSKNSNSDDNKEKDISTNTSNSVGPTRRYVSGDEEKSSSSHQFHKS